MVLHLVDSPSGVVWTRTEVINNHLIKQNLLLFMGEELTTELSVACKSPVTAAPR